ncbi:Fe-S metabolism protein SufE [Pseudomonas agarici]|uniref:Fe-S metabolism protein SufE n=1 Tax=Pseudomonas agarici TaxID=46677 RepID=A0A0X1SXG0_PSEAA|nr:SufE family protein [Pseudomonas agarici]AMB84537.1 Fe-S metabolism protein SufE [Pseudomonas agarici]
MSLPKQAQSALESFQMAASWEQRARLLMQWGERLPPLADVDKIEANRVHGCESQVWLTGLLQDNRWQFVAHGDARIIRGLLGLLLVRVNGLTAEELQGIDLPGWFNQLGLARQLSPSRSNGLHAVLQRMHELTGTQG